MEQITPYDASGNAVTELVQWDYGITIYLTSDEITADQPVHFANAKKGTSYAVVGAYTDDALAVKIPDVVLQAPSQIYGYVFDIDGDAGQAILQFEIDIISRAKPLDYVSSDTDDYTTFTVALESALASAESAAESEANAAASAESAASSAEAAAESQAVAESAAESVIGVESGDLDWRLTLLEQMVLTNSYSVPIETGEDELTLLTDDLGYAIMADWKYETA